MKLTKLTKLTKILCALATVAIATAGCKKDEKKSGDGVDTTSAAKTTTNDTPTPTPTPPEPSKWTSADSLAAFNKCGESFNAHTKDAMTNCYAKDGSFTMLDWLGHDMNHQGLEAVTQSFADYWQGFPDVKGTPQLILANGNKVASINLEEGTNTGTMGGMPATKKKISALNAMLVEFDAGGKIKSERLISDQTTWSHQLGMIKNPTSPTSEKAWPATVTVVASDTDKAKIESNVAVVTGFEAASAKKEMETIKAHIADDIVFRYVPMAESISGVDKYLEGIAMWASSFESMTRNPKEIWGAGDWVVVEVESKGKLGANIPNPKKAKTKGKEVATTQVVFYKVVDGKIAQHWVFENSYAFAVQAGLADPPPAPPADAKKMDEAPADDADDDADDDGDDADDDAE